MAFPQRVCTRLAPVHTRRSRRTKMKTGELKTGAWSWWTWRGSRPGASHRIGRDLPRRLRSRGCVDGTLEIFEQFLGQLVDEREKLHHQHGRGLPLGIDPIKGVEEAGPGHASRAAAARDRLRVDGEAEAELVQRTGDGGAGTKELGNLALQLDQRQ